jgi:DNA-binding MarR family transcriptional regulator
MPQYSVLAGLESCDGMSNADLARRAFVTPQTMQGIIVGLVRENLIVREAHPDHGRVLTATLTGDGKSKVQAAHKIVASAELLARNAIAPADPEVIYAALLQIADAMK